MKTYELSVAFNIIDLIFNIWIGLNLISLSYFIMLYLIQFYRDRER